VRTAWPTKKIHHFSFGGTTAIDSLASRERAASTRLKALADEQNGESSMRYLLIAPKRRDAASSISGKHGGHPGDLAVGRTLRYNMAQLAGRWFASWKASFGFF
jgi:hypothetical protein